MAILIYCINLFHLGNGYIGLFINQSNKSCIFQATFMMSQAQGIKPSIISQQSGSDQSPAKKRNSQIKLKWMEKIYALVKTYALDFIALSTCMILGYVLAVHIFAKNETEYTNGILAASQIQLNKGLRGIFPPLSGTTKELLGKWNVKLVNSAQKSESNEFQNFILNFKPSGDVELFSQECEGSIRMKWKTFSYNLYVKEILSSDIEMQIPNDPKDIECIKKDGEFFKILSSSSIWTVYGGQLFVVSQIQVGQEMQNYMIIFQRN